MQRAFQGRSGRQKWQKGQRLDGARAETKLRQSYGVGAGAIADGRWCRRAGGWSVIDSCNSARPDRAPAIAQWLTSAGGSGAGRTQLPGRAQTAIKAVRRPPNLLLVSIRNHNTSIPSRCKSRAPPAIRAPIALQLRSRSTPDLPLATNCPLTPPARADIDTSSATHYAVHHRPRRGCRRLRLRACTEHNPAGSTLLQRLRRRHSR